MSLRIRVVWRLIRVYVADSGWPGLVVLIAGQHQTELGRTVAVAVRDDGVVCVVADQGIPILLSSEGEILQKLGLFSGWNSLQCHAHGFVVTGICGNLALVATVREPPRRPYLSYLCFTAMAYDESRDRFYLAEQGCVQAWF